ncbi:MAG: Gfo/Idh/MocA family protein [Phycisphaerae bacterium]
METVRFGIVGLGAIGWSHAERIASADDASMRLGAVCSEDPADVARAADEFGVPYFSRVEKMYDSGTIDAVIVATPHYWHPVHAVMAAHRGLHVLCEKPLAATVGPARAMVDQCDSCEVALGVMFQHRTRAVMRTMRRMIADGQLGRLFRVSLTCSDWFRTQAYYDSRPWRGTWDGEGGGVLINQAPHHLDLLTWMAGLPRQVFAYAATRLHDMEAEDTATAVLDYGGGMVGQLYATTAEAPGYEELIVVGDKGTLIAEGERLMFGRPARPVSEHVAAAGGAFEGPCCTWEDVELPDDKGADHTEVIRRFAGAILRGEPMVANGHDALAELELSNALYLSAYRNRPVDMPVSPAAMDRLLAELERKRSDGSGGGLRRKARRALNRLLK